MDSPAPAPRRPDRAFPPVTRRALVTGSLALGGLSALAACGQRSPTTTSPRGIVVTDQRGKTLTFDAPVRRIVTIPMPAAAVAIAVDRSAAHLVGMNDQSWVAIRDSVMASFFPSALDVAHQVARQDFAPNVESILSLEPDVVVQWADQGSGIITPLENAGVTVMGVEYGTLADVTTWLTLFATVLGKPDRGKAMTSRIDSAQAAMAQEAAGRSGSSPSVLYFNRFAEQLVVAGGATFNDSYIRLVGAKNASGSISGGFTTVDVEQVLRWDPDIVLLGNFDGALPKDVYSNPVWNDLSAVRSRRVYKVPLGGYRWDPPSQETPLMWRWLADLAFPPAGGSDLGQQIQDDYAFLYGATPTPSQVDAILWMNANASSANYGQFHDS